MPFLPCVIIVSFCFNRTHEEDVMPLCFCTFFNTNFTEVSINEKIYCHVPCMLYDAQLLIWLRKQIAK